MRVQSGALGFVMHCAQQFQTIFLVWNPFCRRADIASSQSAASIGLANDVAGGRLSETAFCNDACTLADSGSYLGARLRRGRGECQQG